MEQANEAVTATRSITWNQVEIGGGQRLEKT